MTARKLAVPPGRAGKLWLERRLAVAWRGADLLDRKLRILQAELTGLRAAAAQAAAEWERTSADAERWLLRAALLGGQRVLRLAAARRAAEVEVSYATTVGVRHPVSCGCTFPAPDGWAGPVISEARRAHQAALEAAARSAAAAAALRIVAAETAATRFRLRAVRDRWIPLLEQARAEVALAIDELERADGARLRLAAGTPAAPSAGSGRTARR